MSLYANLINKLFCFVRYEVMLFVSRIEADFDAMPPSLRKPCGFKDGFTKHQCCAAFLHFLQLLEKMSPPDLFKTASESLTQQFMKGFIDPDLCHAIENQVPPGDLHQISAFRSFAAEIESASRVAKEKKNEELAAQLRVADFNQVKAKLEADMAVLMERKGDTAAESINNAKDMKYLRDRQELLAHFF